MSNIVIIGNIIGLVGSLFMVLSGLVKTKGQTVLMQTIQIALLSVSNLILGSITGCIVNVISIVRNILSYKEKLTKPLMTVVIVLSTIVTIKFNTLKMIGYLPAINTIIFTLFMNTKSDIKFKLMLIVTMILWMIHDIYIKSYITAIFDFATIVASLVTIYRIKSGKQTSKSEEEVETTQA